MIDALLAADTAARHQALTALDRTLLVEAGAGSGKTSVLAGRAAFLLASGRRPQEIAAITFTELAAGELRERVCAFVAELARGHVRPDLACAFPDGPSPEQRRALQAAMAEIDELVCTTIHGFCQRLLTPYPVEAGMDPGAAVMDAGAGDTLFTEVLETWLHDRLSVEQHSGDLLLALFANNADETDALLREVAAQMRRHPAANVPHVDQREDAVVELRNAVQTFRSFLRRAPCQEDETAQIVEELESLLAAAPGAASQETAVLMDLMSLQAPPSAARKDGGFKAYKKLVKWRTAAKASRSAMTAERLNDEATTHYEACKEAHAAARAYAAGRILHILGGEMVTVLNHFRAAKRYAALIDFDDLMMKARDLLEGHETVRAAFGRRFTAVLVDEFQDTDPLQCEILWRLCASAADSTRIWQDWALRPGALFLVGDPKQAIYRFRRADVGSYVAARARLLAADPDCRLVIGQNFRSFAGILNWVNGHFEQRMKQDDQPGFEALFTQVATPDGHVAIAALPVQVAGKGADIIRGAEAEAIANCCTQLIGALQVRGHDGPRPCRPDDIALLAPTGTQLWRYEQALEQAGIAVSTQAGKGFYRRQEVQDLIALTRTLADARDTLALGALLRGPLVGLTEEELLDVTATLPEVDNVPGRLRLWTELADISHPMLHDTISILQGLARQAHSTTPFLLLSQAVEELQIRPTLRQRQDRTAERALSNLDLFLESARFFDLRGLHAFATELRLQWNEARRTMEGRPDTEEQSVSLVTMHSSKGLEWPVVIPINMGGKPYEQLGAALDTEGQLHLPVFGQHGPLGQNAFEAESEAEALQRHRLWYVATTRARDLLLLPQFSTGVPNGSWMEHVSLSHDNLTPFAWDCLALPLLYRTEDPANSQDRARFEVEAALIAACTPRLRRITPHLAEAGEALLVEATPLPPGSEDGIAPPLPPRGSQARGLVLHKLLEEILTGETADDEDTLCSRAAELALQLVGMPGAADLDPKEVAQTARRGLATPEIQAVKSQLVPEYPVAHSAIGDDCEVVTGGIADAATWKEGRVELIVDWKSDVDPAAATIASYRAQVAAYVHATNATAGLIVFLTSGAVECVPATQGCSTL